MALHSTVVLSLPFKVHHIDWLTYSRGIDRSGERCYKFYVNNFLSNNLLRWLTFLFGSLTVTLTVLLFWIFSDPSICFTVSFEKL